MKQEDAVYLRLPIGWERRPVMIKVLEKDKDAFIQLFSSLINGMVGVYRTNNLNSAELKTNSLKTPISEFEKLDFNEDLEKEYGPFELIEEIDTEDIVLESLGYEDDYIKWVKTHIMGVEEVKKVGKDEYEVTIS